MAEDPYSVLGIARNADQAAIRKAYRALAKKHHPDLNPGDAGAEAAFKSVSSAHDLLSDAEKRAAFDRGEIDAEGHASAQAPRYRDFAEGAAGRRYRPGPQNEQPGRTSGQRAGGWGANEDELGDIFSSIFGAQAGSATSPISGHDELYGLSVELLDAVLGNTKRLTLPNGQTLDVGIPVGLQDGQTLRLRGKGSPGLNGGSPGDALIQVAVKPHRFFRRRGHDLELELPVTLREVVLGAKVSVPTPAGPVSMAVLAGSDGGQVLRLRGRGVGAYDGHAAGDLLVTLRLLVGRRDAALEDFLRARDPAFEPDPRAQMMEPGA